MDMAKITKEEIRRRKLQAMEDNLEGFRSDLNQSRQFLTASGKVKNETLVALHLRSEIKAQRAIDTCREEEVEE